MDDMQIGFMPGCGTADVIILSTPDTEVPGCQQATHCFYGERFQRSHQRFHLVG